MEITPFGLESPAGQQWNLGIGTNGNLEFNANSLTVGTTRMVINDDNGNVGIGTENPTHRLHVTGNRIRLENAGKRLDIRADGSAVDLQSDTSDLFIRSSGVGNHIVMNPFNSDGNVGIGGPQTPTAKLQVRGRIGLESESGTETWNLQVDTNGDLRVNANSTSGGTTRMLINDLSGNVGIGTTAPTQKLHVVGNICATGTIGACSDMRFKTAIKPLTDALDKILAIRGTRFEWKHQEFPEQSFSEDGQIGFIGQELEAICPEAVSTDSLGYKNVDYARLTPLLVEAIKEQQQIISQHTSELKQALAKIKQLDQIAQPIPS